MYLYIMLEPGDMAITRVDLYSSNPVTVFIPKGTRVKIFRRLHHYYEDDFEVVTYSISVYDTYGLDVDAVFIEKVVPIRICDGDIGEPQQAG